jgi:MFS family permease
VFWINIPVGLAAAGGYLFFLREEVEHKSPSIDIAGATLFTIAIGALMFALGRLGADHGSEVWVAAATVLVASTLFVLQERRAAEPIVSFSLWRRRPIATANIVAMLASVALIGITTFLPMYVQLVLHRSPMIAGFALSLMLLGWPAGATIAARTFHRIGLRKVLVTGSIFLPAGAACFVMLTPQSSPIVAGVGSALMGLGMGLSSVCCLVLIQETAGSAQRGSATASNLFARNLGSTLGATMLGAVVNFGLGRGTGESSVSADQLRRLIEAPEHLGGDATQLLTTLAAALHLMFQSMLLVTVLIVVAALRVPDLVLNRVAHKSEKASDPRS